MIPSVAKELSGWGNYPRQMCRLYRPESEAQQRELLRSGERADYIAFGLGRSYGDAALNDTGGVILQRAMNRFLAFDPDSGILECEAGVSLAEIVRFLMPRGFFLPVTPGTRFVTVGGAIANDVHGKNHHRSGCFSEFVLSLRLMLASGETLTCSREENADLFWATVGGIGLTGLILTARIRLLPVETGYVKVHYEKAGHLDEALRLFESGDDQFPYSVAWIDCMASGRALGRSVLMRGEHARLADLPAGRAPGLAAAEKRKLDVPVSLPSGTLNPLTVGLFNSVYYGIHPHGRTKLVSCDAFFYPLDAIANWNRLYGRRGFVQYQAVFPAGRSRDGLTELLRAISDARLPSFLAVLKSSGERGQGLLSFPFRGHTLALDIPFHERKVLPALKRMDEIVLRHGGRVYLGKDAVLERSEFERMYADTLPLFRKIKREVDPADRFASSLSRRIGLGEGRP